MNHESLNTCLLQALTIASTYHAKQKRKSDNTTPYIDHLIEVAYILNTFAGPTDNDELCAAILHDILEDTNITQEELASKVSQGTFDIVVVLSDDKSLSKKERRTQTLIKLMNSSDAVKRVKLADICSNVSSRPLGWSGAAHRSYDAFLIKIADVCKSGSISLYNEFHRRLADVQSFSD
jgi:guanosine-3',5'-bis(diphosphate) 3'-pyrophosphohydrolase